MSRKKPTGGAAFDALASKLLQVPKKELDRQLAKRERLKSRRKKN